MSTTKSYCSISLNEEGIWWVVNVPMIITVSDMIHDKLYPIGV